MISVVGSHALMLGGLWQRTCAESALSAQTPSSTLQVSGSEFDASAAATRAAAHGTDHLHYMFVFLGSEQRGSAATFEN